MHEQLSSSRLLCGRIGVFQRNKVEQQRLQQTGFTIHATSVRTKRVPRPRHEVFPASPEGLVEDGKDKFIDEEGLQAEESQLAYGQNQVYNERPKLYAQLVLLHALLKRYINLLRKGRMLLV